MYKELSKANHKLQMKRLNSKVWTKGDILAFGKMLNSMKFSSPERKDAIYKLSDMLYTKTVDFGYDITKEQSQFGIVWLNKICFTTKGKNRNSKMVIDFMERDFNVVKNFAKFEFVGFDSGNGIHEHYTPIYRTIDKDGNYFDYVARMWAAPEIIGRGKVKRKISKLERALK